MAARRGAARARCARRVRSSARYAPLTACSSGVVHVVPLRLDRVPWLWAAVGPVDDAEEVRSGCRQPELDRAVVQRPDADPLARPGAPQGVLLAVLEHVVDGDADARAIGIEGALDPELHVARGERPAVRPRQPFAEREDVPQPVLGDLPPLRERRDDRRFGPTLNEPVEQRHLHLHIRQRRTSAAGRPRCRCSRARSAAWRSVARTAPAVATVEGRWKMAFASPKRSAVWSARASLKSTTAIACRSPGARAAAAGAVAVDRLVERPLLPGAVGGPRRGRRSPCPRRCAACQWWASRPTTSSRFVAYRSLEPLGGTTMQSRARVSATQQAVRGLLDERMLEAVLRLRPAALGADEVETLKLVQRVARRLAVRLRRPPAAAARSGDRVPPRP